MNVLSIIAGICWAAFLAVWLLGSLYNVARAPKVERSTGAFAAGSLGSWLLPALVGRILFQFVPQPVRAEITYSNRILEAAGVAILFVATIFTLWARFKLGTMWTSSPTIKEHHELRTDGPYSVTRHPIYTGILGMLIGTTSFYGFGVLMVFVALFAAYLFLKIRAEERLLRETFGDRYRTYQSQVPKLLPVPRHL